MSNLANDKGSFSDPNGVDHRTSGGHGPLAAHTYVQGPSPLRKIGNPGPLGLFSFASTTFILSMYNCQARGISIPNAVIGMACFVGGLAQFAAGMWEFVTGNTFGATAFTSYGGFWLAYSAFLHPSYGVGTAYAGHGDELTSAIGIFLAAWFIITFLFLLATLRVNVALIVLFFLLDLTFLLLMVSEFTENKTIHKAGGGVGIVTAFAAFYAGLAQLLTNENSWFTLPLGVIPHRRLD